MRSTDNRAEGERPPAGSNPALSAKPIAHAVGFLVSRTIAMAEADPGKRIDIGTQTEDDVQRFVEHAFSSDFVFRSPLHLKGRKHKETTDVFALFDDVALAIQVKAQALHADGTPPAQDRNWTKRNLERAVSHVKGAIRTIEAGQIVRLENDRRGAVHFSTDMFRHFPSPTIGCNRGTDHWPVIYRSSNPSRFRTGSCVVDLSRPSERRRSHAVPPDRPAQREHDIRWRRQRRCLENNKWWRNMDAAHRFHGDHRDSQARATSVSTLDPTTLDTYDYNGNEITGTPTEGLRIGDVNTTTQPASTPAGDNKALTCPRFLYHDE